MEQYAIYLRKSRADVESEEKDALDILQRHERLLLELARRQSLNITEIYREVVSGDSIAARPQMQELLSAVEKGVYSGVLVVDVDRLARGDTMDQGFVAQAFKYSDTKIITPVKTYNPHNEFDEEYFEFGLFMARREYKIINRRLQRGRLASIKEGKYVANKAPYGYKRIPLDGSKGWTLEEVPAEAAVVRLIFELYTIGEKLEDGTKTRFGASRIARRLNASNILSKTGGVWVAASIRDILINPVYIGKLRWNWRSAVKKMTEGKVSVERPRARIEDCTIVDGLHEGIVNAEVYALAQEYIKKNPPRPVREKDTVKNPLCGLVICGKCGRKMNRRPHRDRPDTLMCTVPECDNVSSFLHLVEERILVSLGEWLNDYKLMWATGVVTDKNSIVEMLQSQLDKLDNEIKTITKQIDNAHDLLEQGVYNTDTFLDRTRRLGERMNQAQADRSSLEKELKLEEQREIGKSVIIPKVEHLLEVYNQLPNPTEKNNLLKEVLEKVVYLKDIRSRWKNGGTEKFEITLYPKLPKGGDSH